MRKRKIHDIRWHKVTSITTLANELLKLQVSLDIVPRNTHVINWRSEPENEALLQETWSEWRKEFPNALFANLEKNSPRYRKKLLKNLQVSKI